MSTLYTTHKGPVRFQVDITPGSLSFRIDEAGHGLAITLDEESCRTLALCILDTFRRSPAPEEDELRYEPDTCGTHHLIAERTLRIIEAAAFTANAIPCSEEAIETLSHLVSQAGVHLARRSLGQHITDKDIPF